MKKSVVVFRTFIAFALVLSMISAVSAFTCNPNQRILQISSTSNAHLENYQASPTTPYSGFQICINQFFSGTVPANPDRTTAPAVLWLSSGSNAHASTTQSASYSIPVRFQGLSCTARAGSCSAGETAILALTGLSNAHASEISAATATYPVRICCTYSSGAAPFCGDGICNGAETSATCSQDCGGSGPACGPSDGSCPAGCSFPSDLDCSPSGTISSAEWRQPQGSPITTSFVNQTVELRATTTLPVGTSVTFEIYEDDPLLDDTVRAGAQALTSTVRTGGIANVSWFINDADMASAIEPGELSDGHVEFYFNATASSSGVSRLSGFLNVVNLAGPNDPPHAEIVAPADRGIYFKDTSVMFSQASTDPQGTAGLTYQWTVVEDNYHSSQASFSYTFTTAGSKTVTLKVTDEYGLSDEAQVRVLVTASPGALGYISAPTHQQVIPAQPNGQLSAAFNGTVSYVIDNTYNSDCTSGSITCLAGPCPAETENSPVACGGGRKPIVAGSNGAFANTNFSWTFEDGIRYVNGTGLANASGTRLFASAGQHNVLLGLDYRDSTRTVSSTASRAFTVGQCVNNGQQWIEINGAGDELQRLATRSSNGACRGIDGINGTRDDCCPTGWLCGGGDSEDAVQCYLPANQSIGRCQDYPARTSCINDAANIVETDPLWAVRNCGQIVNGQVIECQCSWNSTQPTGSNCFFNSTGTSATDPHLSWSCALSYTQSECSSGYRTLDITALFNPGLTGLTAAQAVPACVDEQRQVLCGRPLIELPFFDYRQLIAALVVVALIYLIAHRAKKT